MLSIKLPEIHFELDSIHFDDLLEVTPEVHLLELHLIRKLRMFLRVGPNREDQIEQEHQVQNRARIKASNIRNHSQMQQMMDQRIRAINIPAVAASVASMNTNRKFSIKTIEKKSERDFVRKSAMKQKFENWESLDDTSHSLNTIILNFTRAPLVTQLFKIGFTKTTFIHRPTNRYLRWPNGAEKQCIT
jgi:hypothetical protein